MRVIVSLVILLTAFWGGLSAAAETPSLLVRLVDGRLTLHARNQALDTILEQISTQGVRIRIDPRINPAITARFDNRPVATALAGILKSVDYALIWHADRSRPNGEPQLSELRIFYRGQENRMQTFRRATNLAIIQGADGTQYVRDILLLQLTPEMTPAALAELLDRLGATLLDSYTPLGILRIRLPHGSDVPTIAEALAGTPGIRTAEPDLAYPMETDIPPIATGEALSVPVPARFPAAENTIVAVMDSGLRGDYAGSPFVKGSYDAVSPGAEVGDELGHGTQMSLIAAGAVNPLGVEAQDPAGSPVLAIRAFDDAGYTSTYTLTRAINFAIENGARVVSLSWGSETTSDLLESAVRYATSKGLILVAAAGNAPTGMPVYPAAYESVIGVGALTPDGKAWDQSNYGDFVATSAPGIADLPVGSGGDAGRYAGTSIATAYTARRVAAILNQDPDADRETILKRLKETP
ncbi:Peptidase S8 and S53 subtilisin kexin sedolisin [Desulfosarcina cetonica]|nr:Peptidase S8 and S53 subtilisin kexin sedolisin [Desulfosarcina cetonica]